MDIIADEGKRIAAGLAINILDVAIRALDGIESKSSKKIESLFDLPDGQSRLLVVGANSSPRETFAVLDSFDHVAYKVKENTFSIGRQIHLLDEADKEIGSIKQKSFGKYLMDIAGDAPIRIKSKMAFEHVTFELSNGWVATSNLSRTKYQVLHGRTELALIDRKAAPFPIACAIRYDSRLDTRKSYCLRLPWVLRIIPPSKDSLPAG